ncbi:MAG TPA: hypothetical protein VGD14_10055 [bacterium]
MKAIINYIRKQDNLISLSAWITFGIMFFIFVLTQILTFAGIINEADQTKDKMEVLELIKLRFPPQVVREQPQNLKLDIKKELSAKTNNSRQTDERKQAKASLNIVDLVQGFDMKSLVSRESNAAKRGSSNLNNPTTAGITTDVNRQGRTTDDYDLSGVLENRSTSFSAGRRSAMGGANGPMVGVGGSSNTGTGTGLGGNGLALTGRGTSRSTRGSGTSNGGATITLPSGSGGGGASLDIHAMIRWMKAHPGAIPKLVAYDMGHQGDDLSSAVSFTRQGKNFTLFLSCNETELLLRICLVEGNDFTLLKDNGIREESNFLILGDVVRDAGRIQSLISSRTAPGQNAPVFYQIFWSWWLQQPESRG